MKFVIAFSVYIRRALSTNKLPYIAWPFNLAEFTLLFVLYAEDNGFGTTERLQPIVGMVMEFVRTQTPYYSEEFEKFNITIVPMRNERNFER